MNDKFGMVRPELQALPRIKDRMTFLYLEHCKINRSDGAITAIDKRGIVYIPANVISVLLLGPGTDVSHRAMELAGDAGITVIWVGEHGVRYYASGRPLTHSSSLLIRQAELVSNQRKHLKVVRKMYEMRFSGEDVSKLTMQQLRGREGSRVKSIYRKNSKEYEVEWSGRDYKVDDFSASDPVNQALTSGNQCLYGLAHAVITALGCSPGLGFVHIGHEKSFVYDIADLYKADIVIPLAFKLASELPDDISSEMRRRTRDAMREYHLLEKMVKDIRSLMLTEEEFADENETDVIELWDDKKGSVRSGILYEEYDSRLDDGSDNFD